MVPNKSLDENKIIAAALHDVFTLHGVETFNLASRRNTLQKVKQRLDAEGIGFLTKTLSKLGKAFDKAISGDTPLNSIACRFEPMCNSQLPRFLGELFSRVLDPTGRLLPNPCDKSVSSIRQICYLFYKYKLPYSDEQEQQVLLKFEKTEEDLSTVNERLEKLQSLFDDAAIVSTRRRRRNPEASDTFAIAREARIALQQLFAFFDPKNIVPRHGPGVVATKQQLWEKYLWTNVSAKITAKYPLDEYFYASLGHVCDRLDTVFSIEQEERSARVLLVPKDSRGPRLISCEPVDFQWIQQGLGRAIVELVEHNELTKFNVFFTDQVPNRIGALYGSSTGKYSTLDLNEASDRVSLELVHLLFPPHIYEYLEACRSSSTVLPDGRSLVLRKFAPMGSSLCFPILALTIWALLYAGAPNADARESIHVYGDDVIVTTAYAEDAMNILESFGLKINRDKSCTNGLFRESCGMDAFKGINVTPVRLRTVWSNIRSPEVYASWIAYANSFWHKQYYHVYDCIVEGLHRTYGEIPASDMNLSCPSLAEVPAHHRPKTRRVNKHLQKVEWRVWDLKSVGLHKEIDGWSMLLRYFSEQGVPHTVSSYEKIVRDNSRQNSVPTSVIAESFLNSATALSVSSYTRRRASMLVRRWR